MKWNLLLFWVTLAMPIMSSAAQWSIAPSLTLSETYTSNITASDLGNEQGEFVTQINPAISLNGKGRRLQLNLSYNMQNLLYITNSDRNTTFHQLRANALATVVEDAVFVDMTSSVSQQAISLRERAPPDNLSISNNRTNVITFHISPYLRHAFGDVAATEVRYGYDNVYYDATGFDSESNSYSASLTSGAAFKTFPWSLGYTSNQLASNAKFEMYTAQLRYVASRKLTLTSTGGYENNDYETAPSQQKPSGAFWNTGLIWSPTSRTSAQASYGRRFFGKNYAFSVNHATRRSTWLLSYAENVTTVNLLRPENRLFMISDLATGNVSVDTQTGLPRLVTVIIPTLTNDIYISKYLQASLGYKLKRNNFSFQLFNERRLFQRADELQKLQGGNISWGLQLAPHSNLSINSGFQTIEYSLDGQVDDFWNVGMALRHDIQHDVKGAVELGHTARNSNKSINEAFDNRIVVSLTMTF